MTRWHVVLVLEDLHVFPKLTTFYSHHRPSHSAILTSNRDVYANMASTSSQSGCTECNNETGHCGSHRRASTRFSDYIDYARVPEAGPSNLNSHDYNDHDAPPPLDHDVDSVNLSEIEDITERDFASPIPRARDGKRRSGLQSVRQSMIEPAWRRPRWFEAEESISFHFKLAPRSKHGAIRGSPITKVPQANEDGSSGSVLQSSNPQSTRGISVQELGTDDTAWQRLLTSALFLIKEDDVPFKPGEAKMLDLGLASARQAGGKHLAMRHQSSRAYNDSVASSPDPAKRIKWRVVVKPVKRTERGGLLPR